MNRYDSVMRSLKAKPVGFRAGRQHIHLSAEEIEDAERRLGGTLPEDYREFIQDFGEFGVPTVLFDFKPNNDEPEASSLEKYHENHGFDFSAAERPKGASLERFHGVATKSRPDCSDIASSYRHLCEMVEDWPEELMPFAVDAGSGSVVLAFKGERKGSVYFWDQHNFYLVADTFDEFIHSLRNRDNEIQAKEDAERFWSSYLNEE